MRWPFDPNLLAIAEAVFALLLFGMMLGYVGVALSLSVGLLTGWW